MYKKVYFEISGVCNAKCPWCITGNHSLEQYSPSFVKVQEFDKAVEMLLRKQLIGPSTIMHLYNWGEPLLNPEFEGIIEVLHKKRLRFVISTNASRVAEVNGNLMTYMSQLIISMPGFSQSSYNRIHRFDFHKILENIDSLVKCCIGEIKSAARYFANRNISFYPTLAYFNDYNMAKEYLDGTLRYEVLKEASKELILSYVEEIIRSRKNNYLCPQYEYLVIDEKFSVLTCCAVPKNHPDYSLGSVFDLSFNDIETKKKSRTICIGCNNSGLSFWLHNTPVPSYVEDIIGRSLMSRIKEKAPLKLKLIHNHLRGF
jgi:MoaA/NifB/PqqE/SkfB family radical SAM enzyme